MKRSFAIIALGIMTSSFAVGGTWRLPSPKASSMLISECESFAGRQGVQHSVEVKTRSQALPYIFVGADGILGRLSPDSHYWGYFLLSRPPDQDHLGRFECFGWNRIFAPTLPPLRPGSSMAALILLNPGDTTILRGRVLTPEQLSADYWAEWGRWRHGQMMGDEARPFVAPLVLTPDQFLQMAP